MVQANNKEELNRYWDGLGIITGSLRQAAPFIRLCLETGDVPCLIGEAGTGKTQIFAQVAKEMGAKVYYMFLAHKQPEDLGIPMPNADKTAYRYLCEESLVEMLSDPTPTVLVLDEWNRGERPVMNAAFTMMEQRRFGSIDLPPHIYIGAAMNPSEGNYLVNEAEKDPAFRRRLCFFGVRVDEAVWLAYAKGPGDFHPYVVDFIQRQPHLLMDAQSRESGKVYANPAAWEKISNTLKHLDKVGKSIDEMADVLRYKFAGHVGIGTAERFLAYLKENATAVNPMDVLTRYESVRGLVASLVKRSNFSALDEIITSVVVTAVAHELPPQDIGLNLLTFCQDLPEDKARAVLSKLVTQGNAADKSDYVRKLNQYFAVQPLFKQVFMQIRGAEDRARKDEKAEIAEKVKTVEKVPTW